ncbi:MAG: VCBS repeat-containing protein [Anaerolineae bacterium]|nr:VCBS repeat-containing protein [Anaerolineae bacterium]
MKTKGRLMISARLGLAMAVLAMLGALPTALALETFPTESRGDRTGCAGAADGSCSGGFTQASTDPTGVYGGGVAWGDVDDDGDLDILLAGDAGSTNVTEVWRNEGSNTFTQASTAPTGVREASVAWGDYDDDGDLDILLAGSTSSSLTTEVWENDGGTFTMASTAPTALRQASVAWGDYDSDGDLDILLAGNPVIGSSVTTEVWRNEGSNTFVQASTDPTGVHGGGVAWGDYDDDGDLDILLAGFTGGTRVTEVWRNDGGDTFTQASAAPTGVSNSSVAWGDYDDDGDLDILLAGWTGSARVTEVWRNDGATFVQASTAPTGVSNSSVAWGDYDDDGDLDILLAGYTIADTRVTEVWRNDDGDVFTLASSDPTGVSGSGVAWGDYDDDGDLDILLTGADTVSTLVTEVWRNESCRCSGSTFTQTGIAPTGVDNSSVTWGDYDDDGDLDILLAGYTGSAYVTQVWRNDGSDTFAQAGIALTGIRLGSVAWGDYDHDGDLDILLAGSTGSTTRTTEVWRNNDNGTFTQVSTAPTGISGGGAAWGDYDDDGDLDILLTGHTGTASVTEVWRNDGGTFVQASTAPTGVSHSSVAWGDYDDDGDLDILLAGSTDSVNVTEVWRNDGGDTFTQASTDPTGVSYSSVAWGDYDDDGDLDILLAGRAAGGIRVTEVWRNDGSDTFTQASAAPTAVSDGGVAWGDVDDDGDLDILLAGSTGSSRVAEVWRNDGSGTFTQVGADLTGVQNSSVAWGDYDDDGDLDILLTGSTGSARVTEVWRSACFQVFLPLVSVQK